MPAPNLSIPIVGWSATGDALVGEFVAGAAFIVNLTDTTRLIGGLAESLDAIETTDVSAGVRVVLRHASSGADLNFLLIESPAAEAVPWIVRPDDYHASNNDKGWQLTQVMKDGVICSFDSNVMGSQQFRRLFTLVDGDNDAQLTADQSAPFTISN